MKGYLRKIAKLSLASLAYYSGFLRLYVHVRGKYLSTPHFTILMYHRVLEVEDAGENQLLPGMVTLRSTFDEQMKYLKENFNVITLDRLVSGLKKGKELPPRSVVVTFDDGWRDNYLFAFPILKKYDLPATIFLSTDYINTPKMFWFHKVSFILQAPALTSVKIADILNKFEQIGSDKKGAMVKSLASMNGFIEELKSVKPEIQEKIISQIKRESDIPMDATGERRWTLDWEEIKEMGESRIAFGSHAISHRILTYLTLMEIKKELTQSKRTIEEKTKRPANSFAYPNGEYTPQIKQLVEEMGYHCACGVEEDTKKKQNEIDVFALPRIGIHQGMSIGMKGKFSKALFACQVAGFLTRRRQKHEPSPGY